MSAKIGVLLVNLGTPSQPTPTAVKKYLSEFLSDPFVVNFKPRWLWKIILHGIILQTRPKHSAANYQKIWMEKGSPLLVYSQKLQATLQEELGEQFEVALGMRYKAPSLKNQIDQLLASNIEKLIVLPMFPQYCTATTASIIEQVTHWLDVSKTKLKTTFINDYHDNTFYIKALAEHVQVRWEEKGRPEKLLISFHGVPQSIIDQGDPYFKQCTKTASLLAEALNLNEDSWELVFQSRFGRQAWLTPYCDKTLIALAENGTKHVDIVCPGFSVDCLETLEEININYRQLFTQHGGQKFHYIPALNNTQSKLYAHLIHEDTADGLP
jgi:ferrochelatase